MAKQVFTNFARTTLAAGITGGQTSITVTDGSAFASPTAGDWQVCVIDNGTTFEVVHLTSRSGGTFTIVRAQEGTSGSAFSAGDSILAPVTAAFANPLTEINLSTFALTGALAATKGGTAQSTYAKGDTLYASAVDTLSKLVIGSNGAILQVATDVPAWTTTPTIDQITLGTALKGSATNPAAAGVIRLANGQLVAWRNNGNTADFSLTIASDDILALPATSVRLANDNWLIGRNNAGTGNVNIAKVNTNDNVQFGNSATDQKFGFGGAPTFLLHALGDIGWKVTNYTSGPTTIADTVIATGDATGGAFTLNLPAAASSADKIVIAIKIDASANAVTLSGNGSNINGAGSVSLASQYDVAMVFCNGTQWYRIV